jgi:phage shock protein A
MSSMSSTTWACRLTLPAVAGCCRLKQAEDDLEAQKETVRGTMDRLARLQEDFDTIQRELTELKAQGNTKEAQKEMQVSGRQGAVCLQCR